MQQTSIFDEPTPAVSIFNKQFNGVKSVMENGRMHSVIKSRKKEHHRYIEKGDKLDVYRNLNRPNFFSAKAKSGQFKNLVAGYARCYILKDVGFFVGTGREKAIAEQTRNVHAYARGVLVDAFDGLITELNGMRAITYNPFNEDKPYFHFKDTGELIEGIVFDSVIVQGANVWVEA